MKMSIIIMSLIMITACGKKETPATSTTPVLVNNATEEASMPVVKSPEAGAYIPPIASTPTKPEEPVVVVTPKPNEPQQEPSLTCIEYKKVCERPCKKYSDKDPKVCVKRKFFKVCTFKCIKTGDGKTININEEN